MRNAERRASPDTEFRAYVLAQGRKWERYAYLLTADADRSRDLVQTVLLKVYRHWARITALEAPDSYVRRMLTNTFLDQRRRRSETEIPVGDLPERSSPDIAAGVVERDAVRRALNLLTPSQRAVLVLRHVEGLDDNAIAETLHCSPGTVRTHAARGRERFRAALAGHLEKDSS